ncbi:hypothetical protein BJ742DRAFT_216711 [Cladochytrium replicatum]|nr:hypothetical protein BJ742DRAFT_216711 [Cladochytrium replicatum]
MQQRLTQPNFSVADANGDGEDASANDFLEALKRGCPMPICDALASPKEDDQDAPLKTSDGGIGSSPKLGRMQMRPARSTLGLSSSEPVVDELGERKQIRTPAHSRAGSGALSRFTAKTRAVRKLSTNQVHELALHLLGNLTDDKPSGITTPSAIICEDETQLAVNSTEARDDSWVSKDDSAELSSFTIDDSLEPNGLAVSLLPPTLDSFFRRLLIRYFRRNLNP